MRGRVEGIDRQLDRLEVAFQAAVAAEEEIASADLALSLAQGLDLSLAVSRCGGALVLPDGSEHPVDLVARDFVASRADGLFVPNPWVAVRSRPEATTVGRSDGDLLTFLRTTARSAAHVEVGLGSLVVNGRLVAVGRDHAVVQGRGDRYLLGLPGVRWIRLCRGG